ncbi:hypothetical protein FQZ97_866630 [compost metagenome]
MLNSSTRPFTRSPRAPSIECQNWISVAACAEAPAKAVMMAAKVKAIRWDRILRFLQVGRVAAGVSGRGKHDTL